VAHVSLFVHNYPLAKFKQFTASICPCFCVLDPLWQ
jgi:hypothetical protein